jgi:hypothetical protein
MKLSTMISTKQRETIIKFIAHSTPKPKAASFFVVSFSIHGIWNYVAIRR